jgi:ribosome-associated translation inhibitor RaiA
MNGEFMQVQVNHDNNIRIGAEVAERLSRVLEGSLSQFADRITRIEMHLGDENAGKAGDSDKRCMIEARLANLAPIAVTHQAESLQLAFEGALEKLEHALSHAVGKLQTH